jgi:aldose 1-epimerase
MRPSGQQYEITHREQRAVITEVGATLRLYEHAGAAVLAGFDEHEMPDACRNQLCYPWINRFSSGPWTFSNRHARVGADDLAHQTLLHGVARWRPFEVREHEADRCTLSLTLHPVPEYPFLTSISVQYRLADDGLSVSSTVTNLDDVVAPFALGFHPYFAVSTDTIEGATLTIPAQSYLAVDERMLPTGHVESLDGHALDFRQPSLVDEVVFDVTYADLIRDESGLFHCTLVDENGGGVVLSQDESFPFFQVFSGDTLAPEHQRTAMAMEPMTAPADALRSGEGLICLEPGEQWSGYWRVQRRG